MLIKLGYQFFMHVCSGNYLGNIFFSLFQFFFFFFCVKRLDDVSGCPDSKVASSGCPFSMSGRACICNLLRDTTSGRHLSFVRTMNPVGLYRIPPVPQPLSFHFFFLCFFFVLCPFPCFLCVLLMCTCPFCNLSPP
jgi:hypothetical protein